jgi:hypothetical protein
MMSPELEQKLTEKYPSIFADRDRPPTESLMCFGCECGDGWFDLLDALCFRLTQLDSDKELRAMQVKEKFGTLRFYTGPASDAAYELISFAEDMSARTCEACGNKGSTRGGGWVVTLCDACDEKRRAKI